MRRNLQYWVDYWTSLFSGIEHRRFSLSLISPRVLLRELREEVDTRGLKNSDNRDFLIAQINRYFETDVPTQQSLHSVMTLIRREFEKPRLEVLAQLCQRGLDTMDRLEYFDRAVDALRELLIGEADVKRDQLYMLCQDLIVELLEAGYSQKYIETIPRKLFSGVTEHEDIVTTEFPHDLPFPTDPEDISAKNEYRRKLKLLIEGLTDADRIDALKRYPRLPRRKLRFVFEVRGVRGELGFEIGPVRFYPPTEEKVLKDPRGKDFSDHPELFRSGDHVYLNAVVAVPTPDTHSGAAIAKRKVIEAINCLRFAVDSRACYEVGQDYIAVDEAGRLAGMSSSMEPRSGFLHWHESLDVTADVAQEFEDSDILQTAAPRLLGRDVANSVEQRLMDSLHWFRKGKEAEAPEDQILWLWISIECILGAAVTGGGERVLLDASGKESVVSIAFELLPRLRCLATAYDRGWALFRELKLMISIPTPTATLAVPDEIKARAGLNQSGKKVYLRDFVEAIPDLLAHMPDIVLREHLAEAHAFYTDGKKACASIEADRKAFRNDAVMLYRTRNKIVHSATVGDTMLPYYVRSASEFARELIRKTFGQYFHEGNGTLRGAVAALYSEYDLLMQKIEKEGPASALFDEK